ncbi:MAG: ribosome silencing factor [Clostridia bacterium]|nr:ribosome silencing factor [Clostridia bacterium]
MDVKTDILKNATSKELARAAVAILIEKKALDVRLYEVGEENPITDFYVNATGRSLTQVGSLADEIVYKLELSGVCDAKVEGKRGNAWILVDYGNVIVNIFDKESRDFYNLDRLMPEGTEINISDIVQEVDKKLEINTTEEE